MTTVRRRRSGLYIPRGGVDTYDSEVLLDSPALYWKLADPVGTTSLVKDEMYSGPFSGSVEDGVTFGSTPLVTSDSQTSVAFSGGRIARQYEPWMTTNDFTFECILLPTGITGQKTIGGIDDNGTALKFRVYMVNATLNAVWRTTGGSYFFLNPATNVFAAATKSHLAWTYEASGNSILYHNGTSIGSVSANGTLASNTVADVEIGSLVSGFEPFIGNQGRVAIYTHALSAARIAAHAALV